MNLQTSTWTDSAGTTDDAVSTNDIIQLQIFPWYLSFLKRCLVDVKSSREKQKKKKSLVTNEILKSITLP